jgi:hypothetical protein
MLIIITCGSCLFGGHMYNMDSFMDVIPMLVFPLCWDGVDLNDKLYIYVHISNWSLNNNYFLDSNGLTYHEFPVYHPWMKQPSSVLLDKSFNFLVSDSSENFTLLTLLTSHSYFNHLWQKYFNILNSKQEGPQVAA